MSAAWHDVECSLYDADLPLWRQLAADRGGPVLDVGAGTGRVALDLAALGHEVVAVDLEPSLVEACAQRARARSLPVTAIVGDARRLTLASRHPLAIFPMQVAQLLGSDAARADMLAALLAVLEPGGLVAVALADPFEGIPANEVLPPLPDVLEVDGWVYSSTPVALRPLEGSVAIDRRRQSVSPAGELTDEQATIVLDSVDADAFARQGAEAGYTVLPYRSVPDTRDYVGSTVVMLEAPR